MAWYVIKEALTKILPDDKSSQIRLTKGTNS